MRSVSRAFALACTMAFAVTQGAFADEDVAAQLRALQERMQQLEDRLEATSDQLEAANERVAEQQEVIERAGLDDPAIGTSGLMGFLSDVQITGHVSTSYWYNFNDPDNNNLTGANTGLTGSLYTFNPDANQFSFDQLWFGLERPVSPEHRAGFRADVVYGKVARLAPLGNTAFGGNNLYIGQAYVQYLAETPIGDVQFLAGKFFTPVGQEVVDTTQNWFITRSNVWAMLQAIDHVGVLALHERDFDTWKGTFGVGVVNGVAVDQPDVNDAKTLLFHFAAEWDAFAMKATLIQGKETVPFPGSGFDASLDRIGNESQEFTGIDVVLNWQVNDKLATYLDANFNRYDATGGADPKAWGVAVAGRYAITDRLGAAVRADYVKSDQCYPTFPVACTIDSFGAAFQGPRVGNAFHPTILGNGVFDDADTNFWSLTGTVDYLVTDHLKIRGEARWDKVNVDTFSDDYFISDGDRVLFGADDQATIGVEAIYQF